MNYIFKTTATMKEYNNKKWYIDGGIVSDMLIETTETRPGDIIRVYKNDMGYCGYNPRTNRHFYIFVFMLRNAEIFKLQEVLQ